MIRNLIIYHSKKSKLINNNRLNFYFKNTFILFEMNVDKNDFSYTSTLKIMYNDGELFQNTNTRVPSEPKYNLRKRFHPQHLQATILLLTHEFEKLIIH